jgi:lysozyme
MNLSANGFEVLKKREGFDPVARFDGAKWTIGHGNTFYENGQKVKPGERITSQRATNLFRNVTNGFVSHANRVIKSDVNQSQFDSLVSFSYNVGKTAFTNSTLLKKVNASPNDPAIRPEFLRWVNSKGRFLQGLKNRRVSESDQYFNGPAALMQNGILAAAGLGLLFIINK